MRTVEGIYYDTIHPHESRDGVVAHAVPLVLLHGLGRSHRAFLDFPRRLARGRSVVVLDNRGIGASRAVPLHWTHSIADLAHDTASVLRAAGFVRAHLVGLSLGGNIALETACLFPNLVASLTLINSGLQERAWHQRISLRGLLAMAHEGAELPGATHAMGRVLLGRENDDANRAILAAWDELRAVEGVPRLTVLKQAWIALRQGISPRLGALDCPTLVIAGTKDRFVPPIYSVRLHRRIPKSQFMVIPGAGHEMTADFGGDLANAIEGFLAANERGPKSMGMDSDPTTRG